MRASYSQLINEHDEIAKTADRLLDCLFEGATSLVASRLAELDRLVRDHIQRECSALAQVEPTRLSAPWDAAWGRGMPHFRKLQADWIMYLYTWDEDTIATRRADFIHATELMLPRLRERMATENEALCSVALQTAAITLN